MRKVNFSLCDILQITDWTQKYQVQLSHVCPRVCFFCPRRPVTLHCHTNMAALGSMLQFLILLLPSQNVKEKYVLDRG